MKKLVIAGGSGFLGNAIIEYFKDNAGQIILLSRKANTSNHYPDNVQIVQWDGHTLSDWASHIEGATVLINMAGRSVDCRYTTKNKNSILNSRLHSTTVLGKAIEQCLHPPKIWLNSSTATIYRHSLDQEMTEKNGEIGSGFSVNVAQQWEEAFFNALTSHTRKVALRTTIVLGKEGGALLPLIRLTNLGFGGKQGDGNQKFSWIHEEDFVRSIDFIISNTQIDGVVNIAAPEPSTNRKLMYYLRQALKRPLGIPMGKILLEIGARIIQTETELILKSRNVIPDKLLQHKFNFKHPTLQKAIAHLIG